jgi:hypothetical protein
MVLLKPLVFDVARGVNRQLDAGEGLAIDGALQLKGGAGFFGVSPLVAAPPVSGPWGQTVDELISALSLMGLIADNRPAGWTAAINGITALSNVGPYEPGRLIIGSITGWMQLDQPAAVPGVIQVPASHAGATEVHPSTRLPMQQLAYSPILSYGAAAPPSTPLAGALWFDTTSNALKVFSGSGWVAALPANLAALGGQLAAAAPGALLRSDGAGGATMLAPATGRGQVVMFDGSRGAQAVDLITVGATSPWADGASCYAPAPGGGGRPGGIHQAIWCNSSTNAETINFWDEVAHQWKGIAVNNPVLNQLAELRGQLVDGDLLTVSGNQLVRVPIGASGSSFVVNDRGEPSWHQRFSGGPLEPTGALDGDVWVEDTTGTVRLREGGRWVALNSVDRYVDSNGSGGAVLAGTLLSHQGGNWKLAAQNAPAGTLLAIALEGAAVGAPLSAALGGVVSLSAAQWSAVIDAAEPHAAGTGLAPGRDYFVSSLSAGQLTTKPANALAVPVGTALSSTHLLLRPMTPAGSQPAARVISAVAAPAASSSGLLWWSPATQTLSVYQEATTPGAAGQWLPVLPTAAPGGGGTGGGGGGGALTAPVITDIEAIDWIADPLAAALRFSFSDGTSSTLRLRGAGGASVTMADNRTLVIDAGGSSTPPPIGGGGGGGAIVPTGVLVAGNGVMADPVSGVITGIDEGLY